MTDERSLEQCRCPHCDSADMVYHKDKKEYECLKCGRKYQIEVKK